MNSYRSSSSIIGPFASGVVLGASLHVVVHGAVHQQQIAFQVLDQVLVDPGAIDIDPRKPLRELRLRRCKITEGD